MMQRFARITDGWVVEVIELPETTTIPDPENEGETVERPLALADAFHPDLVVAIVPAPAEVEIGWAFADGEFSSPPPPPPLTVEDLLSYAADKRWKKETGGLLVAGFTIATDDRSKLLITGSRVAAAANPAWSTMWEGIHLIDAATMIQISDAVEAHVNGVWSTFAAVKVDIEAGTCATREQIDVAFA